MLRQIKILIYLAMMGGIIFIVFVGYQFHQFQSQPVNMAVESQVFTIKSGSSIRQVAQDLADLELISDPIMFIALARFDGEVTTIKAGEYMIDARHTPGDLVDLFRRGDSVMHSLTIIEGWTFRQMMQAVKANPILVKTIEDYSDTSAIMAMVSEEGEHPEGRFLPDTYLFPRGTTDISFLKRAYRTMTAALAEEWEKRQENLPLKTPYEALILASIIEKETGAAFERPLIAAAFIQRLRKGMRLQTDPTIIYGLGESFDGDIRYRDLRKDTPYNTYIHHGLTPTPIALPGVDAIKAALNPADSDAIFFVSKGDGTHHFSKTLEEHNQAVSKYQLKGRKPKRKAEPG